MRIREVIEMRDVGVIETYAIGEAVGATIYLEPVVTLDIDVFVALRPEPGKCLIDRALSTTTLQVEGAGRRASISISPAGPSSF